MARGVAPPVAGAGEAGGGPGPSVLTAITTFAPPRVLVLARGLGGGHAAVLLGGAP
jgi:hypothetical protein